MQPCTRSFVLALAAALFAACASVSAWGAPLRISGSTTVNLPVAEAAEILRTERGMEIHVDTQGGSPGGIAALGDGRVQIAMSSKRVTDAERARYPGVRFTETRIGEDAVALVVSSDVWEGGVRALSRDLVRGIYEGRTRNWKELGGADRRIAFFNKEPGRGTWEVFAQWLYGDAKKAPAVSFPEVGGNEEARNKVGGTRGALSMLSVAWVDRKRVFDLGLRQEDGSVVQATTDAIASRAYALSRPLFLVTDGPPRGEAEVLMAFLLSERGQAIVRRHGYLPLDAIKP